MSIIPNSYADQQRTHKAGNAGKQYRVQNEDRVSNERVQQRDQGMQAGLNKSVKDVKNNQNNYIKQQSVKRREPKNSPIDQIIRNHSVSQ